MSLLPGRNRDVSNSDSRREMTPETSEKYDPLTELDEDGTELHKEARVWKAYVKEADRHDTELVKGWNDSTDVILIFAALFSAISTAFIIESSKMLQEDPLVTIAQTLLSIANGTQASGSPSSTNTSAEFTPSRTAIWVNALWYLSLSLSLATSFIAILAKDWCHSFMSNRTGHPYLQTRQRQQKWDMIQVWRMPELLAALPSIIHLALFLFACGLCILLWDTHPAVALPVVCVAGVAFAFYASLSAAATFLDYFPYPTIVSRICRTEIARRTFRVFYELPFLFAFVLSLIFFIPVALVSAISERIYYFLDPPLDYPFKKIYKWLERLIDGALSTLMNWLWSKFSNIRLELRRPFARGSSTRPDGDQVTSLALSWLIKYCEVPDSVDVALQSIAGATNRISRQPLLDCQAPLEILRRLASSNLYRGLDTKSEIIESLYTRALSFLGVSTNQNSETGRKSGGELKASIWNLQMEAELKLADLIAIGGFDPSPRDLKALRIGSTVASTSQKVLKKEVRNADVKEIFDSIIDLLRLHSYHHSPLHDTSLLSLIHAATLLLLSAPNSVPTRQNSANSLTERLMSSGSFPELSGDWEAEYDFADANKLLPVCAQLLRDDRYPRLVTMPAATCILLYSMCKEKLQTGQPYDLNWSEQIARRLVVEGYSKEGIDLQWIYSMQLPGVSVSERMNGLGDYVSQLGSNFVSEYQAAHPIGYQAAEIQPGAEVSPEVREDIVGSGFYILGAIYSLGPVTTPSPALYVSVVEVMCRTPPSSPPFACGAQILSKCPFPTLSDEFVTALEQHNLVRLLETTSTSDDETKQYFPRGQLWLLLSLYIYAGGTASGRDKLKVELDKWRWNGDESEQDRHRSLGGQLFWEVTPGSTIARDLGVWAWRLEECLRQSRGYNILEYVHNALRDVPPELRGLSSFTAWPQQADDPPPNRPQRAEQVVAEVGEGADATDPTTQCEDAADGDAHAESSGLAADVGEARAQEAGDVGRVDASEELEATAQVPTDQVGESVAVSTQQGTADDEQNGENDGLHAEGDGRSVAGTGNTVDAANGLQSGCEETENGDAGQGGSNEGDVVIPMDKLEEHPSGSMPKV